MFLVLRTFWVWYKDESSPYCEAAWMQSTADDNPDGWAAVCDPENYGNHVQSYREIEIRLDYDAVLKHWMPDPIEGKV